MNVHTIKNMIIWQDSVTPYFTVSAQCSNNQLENDGNIHLNGYQNGVKGFEDLAPDGRFFGTSGRFENNASGLWPVKLSHPR
jgi:hypothetical protein